MISPPQNNLQPQMTQPANLGSQSQMQVTQSSEIPITQASVPPAQASPMPLTKPWAKRLKRILPAALLTLGSIMIANVAWPILSYQLLVSPRLQKSELVTPIELDRTVFYSVTPAEYEPTVPRLDIIPDTPQALGQEKDYTKASNWFNNQNFPHSQNSKITNYTISIPKVNVDEAIVTIGGEDLSESLVQYPGTSNPGQLGSPVVFGHSVLRQFYNPDIDNPRRYISIFSKIMTLKNGDEIIVEYDGIKYNYLVQEKYEVKPDDVFILQQRYNQREIKLVTCVPEGTYLRRGVIVATLQDIHQERSQDL